MLFPSQEQPKIIPREHNSGQRPNNRGRIDKQNPLIALKVLGYLKSNPGAFHSKFKKMEIPQFLKFVKFLVVDCGCTIYKKRSGDPNEKKNLKQLHSNLRKW